MEVILPAADEPVRRGGWVLTDDGWVPEDGTAPVEDQEPAESPAEDEE